MAYADIPLADGRDSYIPPALRAVLKRYTPSGGLVASMSAHHVVAQPIVHSAAGGFTYVFFAALVVQMCYGIAKQCLMAHRDWINRDQRALHDHVYESITVAVHRCSCGVELPTTDSGLGDAAGPRYH